MEKKIDLCYNKFDCTLEEFEIPFSRYSKNIRPYLEAIKNKHVISVNSFQSMYLPENKAFLYYLKTPEFLDQIDEENRQMIENIIPKTFLLEEYSNEEEINLFSNKDQLVLKKKYDTRGRNVLIGKFCSSNEWNKALRRILEKNSKEYIIQEYCPAISFFPCKNHAKIWCHPSKLYTTLSYFLFSGNPLGPFVRTSSLPVTNIGISGILQPAMISR